MRGGERSIGQVRRREGKGSIPASFVPTPSLHGRVKKGSKATSPLLPRLPITAWGEEVWGGERSDVDVPSSSVPGHQSVATRPWSRTWPREPGHQALATRSWRQSSGHQTLTGQDGPGYFKFLRFQKFLNFKFFMFQWIFVLQAQNLSICMGGVHIDRKSLSIAWEWSMPWSPLPCNC